MRINKFIAQATGLSRRAADQAVASGRVSINQQPATLGTAVSGDDLVTLDGQPLATNPKPQTIMLNKPAGYVCSRSGQRSRTIYDLLPPEFRRLKSIGRLDKASSGLLLLTDDGDLANQLSHPRYAKQKVYEITLDKPLTEQARSQIEQGVELDDGLSQLALQPIAAADDRWRVTMSQGRNRQIRRTFASLGYEVLELHRTQFGSYELGDLPLGQLVIL